MRPSTLLAFILAPASMGLTAAPAAEAPPPAGGDFVITGDLSASYSNGDFVLFWSKPRTAAPATGMAPAMSMAPATGMAPAKSKAPANGKAPAKEPDPAPEAPVTMPNEVGRATLVDGRFVLEGTVDQIESVYFYVLNATTPSGLRLAPTKGQVFILEPGNLSMTMNDRRQFSVSGGYYNEAVYGWRQSAAYLEAETMKNRAFTPVPGETEEEKAARHEKGMEYQNSLYDIENEGRAKTSLTHPDVFVRQLTIQTAWLGGPWMLEGAYSIRDLDPDNQWAIDFIARAEERNAQRARNAQIGSVGTAFRDFETKTISGDTISLSSVCSNNRYVLLEFWASWCGPCRAEIPHMKKAYARYHDKGFEIFSFTIDDKKSAWIKASEKERLPWIDTGMGTDSEPKKLYEVMGVPANYLIDGATGEVIARNLRGAALDHKLEELLTKP